MALSGALGSGYDVWVCVCFFGDFQRPLLGHTLECRVCLEVHG